MRATEWKPGLSTSIKLITEETFKGYAESGIECMEVSVGHISFDSETDYKLIKKWAKEYGINLWSYHIPFAPFEEVNIATLDKELRKASVEFIKKKLDIVSELETGIAVIHPSGEPNKPEERASLMESAKECLNELAGYAAHLGITIAVEDLPRTCLGNCSADIKELISADSRLRVCFDTNHLLDENNIDFVKAIGDKIITLHVSDYDFRNERHWLPYEGKNDWVGLVTALEDVGYSGPFLFEIGRKAPESIARREITYKDFYDNYKACVNKVPAPVLGTPVEEVCDKSAYHKIPKIQ